ncbi:MAG: Ig-like domain-containing protein [Rudaea sp.]
MLIVGGQDNNLSQIFSAELFDPGLAPADPLIAPASRKPIVSAANSFLLQTSQLAATGSGFVPLLEASGGATNNSATNMPVFQVQRLDNGQMRFIPNDETVNLSNTSFTGSATALAGFPAGPVLVRTWVNGIPSAAWYSNLAVVPGAPTLAPNATGGVQQVTVNFAAPSYNGGAPITSYTATASPGGAMASCTAPCTSIVFNHIAAGTYTFTVKATNPAGAGSASASSNGVLVQATSATSLFSATNPSTFGQSVTFTATVTGESPIGIITFNDGATAICTAVSLSSARAMCTTLSLSFGAHSITAVYSGDTNNSASTSPVVIQIVNAAAPGTVLSTIVSPSPLGQDVTFTATVTGVSPTGTVTFNDGVTTICSGVILSSGSATCSIDDLTLGSHSITAVYSGDANNVSSTSPIVTQVITMAATNTLLDSNLNPSTFGQNVTLTATVTGQSPTGTVTFRDNVTPICSAVTLSSGRAICATSILSIGSHPIIAEYSGDTNNTTSSAVVLVQVVGGFVALMPARILDTRGGFATSDGMFAGIGALEGHGQVDLNVLGRGGVAKSGVDSVVLNVTVTNPSVTGFATVWPTGAARPAASNLNFVLGDSVSNLVVVKLGATGQVSLFNSAGSTDLIADVVGYFTAGSDLTSFDPARLLDTRSGKTTSDGLFEGQGPVTAHGQLDLTLKGRGTIPNTGVGAVIMSVTATNPSASGFITVWPTDGIRPAASNLNFVPNQTIANLVISKLSSAGQVSIFNSAGATDLIADVTAWLPTSAELTSLPPARLLDTRAGRLTIDGQFQGQGAFIARTPLDLVVTGRGGVPASGVGAVVLNITVTTPTQAGFLVAWPSGTTRPATSNLNFATDQTIANLVIAQVGVNGDVSLFANANTDAIVDVVGWFPGGP